VGTGIWLSHNSTLSAGIQAAYVYKQIRWDGISFPDQYNREKGRFDSSMATGEYLESSASSFPDLGFGLLYSKLINTSVLGFGYSLQQINRPRESFFNIERTLPFKHILHAKADVNLDEKFFLIPSAVFISQQKNNALLAGVNLGYVLNNWGGISNTVIGGLHIRNAAYFNVRSMIYSAGFTWQYYTLMLSYDSPVAGSGTTGFNNNALEITLGFRLPSTELKYKTIPCERY
jgi:type IX secretion system PorP/SprF family membrane protein